MKTADEILKEYEDKHEHHFHELDREWIVKAMEEFADQKSHKTQILPIGYYLYNHKIF